MTLWERIKLMHEEEGEGAWARTFIAGGSALLALVSLLMLVYANFAPS